VKIAFVGGGTGGHLAPGIGVAEILRREGHETLFLVAGRPVELDMLAPRQLESRELFGGSGGRPPLLRVDTWYRATRRFRREVDAFDPDVVVVLGGWVALPAVWSGFGQRPTVLIESNARPGRVQRLLARRVDHACLSVDGPGMPQGRHSTRVTGTPTPALVELDRIDALTQLGLEASRRTLLVTGGSQGADDLNRLVPALCAVLQPRPERWQVLHIAGRGKLETPPAPVRSRPQRGTARFELPSEDPGDPGDPVDAGSSKDGGVALRTPSARPALTSDAERLLSGVATRHPALEPPVSGQPPSQPRPRPLTLPQARDVPVLKLPFLPDMSLGWCAADVAVCRAGAGTVAELSATGTPAVLVPYPHHADRHQACNGQFLVDAGAALMVGPEDPTGAASAPRLLATAVDSLEAMSESAHRNARPDAAEAVAAIINAACSNGSLRR
jgi:UDP-N-acetylglucosamine--N-acetylmuramyl-(pentapeptide) pyrophosphoryl-undecaprenol N-acetylglucosamine transferase